MSHPRTRTSQATPTRPRRPVARRLINCVCVHLVEIYLSIIQRKVLKPNDYISLEELAEAIHAFGRRYSALDKPFAWCFTGKIWSGVSVSPNFN